MEGSASQAGFYYQNNIAALKLLEALFFESDIHQVRLENYEKGHHIDDVIVYRDARTDFFQVKWSEDADNAFTLFNLLAPQAGKKSIFKQLAEGYKSALSSGKDFSITLVTTKRESSQKRPSEGLSHSLPQIRQQVFEKFKASSGTLEEFTDYDTYKEILEKIRTECDLSSAEFPDFIRRLHFSFSQPDTPQIQGVIRHRMETLGIEVSLMDKLLNAVVKWSISGESIDKQSLLRELGVLDRFDDKLSQFFRVVGDEYYVPNRDLFQRLDVALHELDGGYVFIEGLPGSGKSTALTKFAQANPGLSLAYYCFIPDTRHDYGEWRHQGHYFLKSLCIAIERQFPEVDLPIRYSDQWDEKFWLYIAKLSQLGRKVVFIIDGLDHVHRDTSVGEASMLRRIKGKLPENIYFVLSSQYASVLTASVRLEVDSDPRRHIRVMPFSQQEILEYLQNKGIESEGILDKVEQKSGGIPVYLHYISEILLKVDAKEYISTLEGLPLLADGEINTYHSYLFQTIQDDSLARWVLAVLAYRRENSSMETIQKLLELAGESKSLTEIEAVLMRFSHLLRQTDARVYSIFHNSFREFIISRAQDLRTAFHRALVGLYEKEPFSDEAYRNYFDHLLQSKEYSKILSLASVEWLKSAWNHFRPLQEIAYNLEIALDAAIAEQSLPDFIRLAFLKAQADRATFNLESADLDFPLLLLEAGETAASLRHIWDGDFVLTSKEYFCRYLDGYYKIHAAFPHQNVLRQGFSKPLSENDAPHLILEWKTLAMVYGYVEEIFAEIDATTWHTSDRMHRNYVRQAKSQEKNTDFNRQIKIKIVRHLARHKKYKELLLLDESSVGDPSLHQAVQIALIQVLLPIDSERAFALERLKDLDYETMSYPKFCSLVVFCSDYLSDAQIRECIPSRPVILPALVGKVIEEGRGTYTLHKDIVGLFDRLKVAYVYDSRAVQVFRVKASAKVGRSNRIYQSILELAELWHLQKQGGLDQSEVLRRTDTSLSFLHLDLAPQLGLRSPGLFDMDNDDYFIARGMVPLVRDVLRLAVNALDEASLRTLILRWLDREKRNNAWSYHTLGITVAKCLYSLGKRLPDLERAVLARAEHLAAADHDTLTLVSHLGEVSQAYGQGGYREDFQRLYNQLIEHAFGVGHRKDYQATNILEPLELIHESDPQGTLQRIAENLCIFNTLSEAGNGRMHHIALSSMIRFVAKDYLQLAFELMHREEAHINRDDVLESILPPRIKTSTADELDLYWAIVKTLPRWNKRESNGFRSCSKYILQRAIHFDNNTLMEEVLETVKNNLIVELQEHSALKPFAQVMRENGKTCTDFGIPEPDSIEDEEAAASPALEKVRNKFSLAVTELDLDELKKLFASDFKSFEQYIDSHYTSLVQRDRNRYLREQYRQIRPLFETFIDDSAPHLAEIAKNNSSKLIRQFILFKDEIVGLSVAAPLDFRRFGGPLMSMAGGIDTILGGDGFQRYLTDDFDTKRWFNQLKHGLRDDRDFMFSRILTDQQLFDLVAAVSLPKLEEMANFVNKYSRGRTRTAALLKISHRLAGIDPERAKATVKQLPFDGYDDLLFRQDSDPLDLGFDIIETLFRLDADFAKEFTLDSYRRQKGRYAGDMTGSIDKLIRYGKHFDTGHESIREYYEANLSYNRELAAGLPQKANTYDYVENHVENVGLSGVVIGHLKWLFNYPAMKIRHLSLQSAYDLLVKNPGQLPIFIEEVLEKGADNETEYGLIVLLAVALKDPSILLPFKLHFMRVLSREHFSIQEHLRELLILIDRNHTGFLSKEEKTLVDRINTPSGLVYPPYGIVKSARGKTFLFSGFQSHLLATILELETGEVSVADLLYSDLVRSGWNDYGQADDSAVHRQYNRNTNFDTIEIQSPYYDQVKASLNTILAAMVKRNEIETSGIANLKELMRVYDPSALLYSIAAKPDYVNWIPAGIDKKDFMAFSDLEGMMNSFADREIDMVTLYESGNQRSHEYKVLDGTTYFEIYAYLKKRKATLGESDHNPYRSFQNAYAYELPKQDVPIDSFPVKGVQPVVQVSYGEWRGENGAAYALPFPELMAKWGFDSTLSALLGSNGSGNLRAMHWIGPYDFASSDRRVYMPFSEGFTLRVDKKILKEYLLANDLVLAYHISIRRASDEYIAERAMRFKPFESDFEVDI